jgi:hypothetical protein
MSHELGALRMELVPLSEETVDRGKYKGVVCKPGRVLPPQEPAMLTHDLGLPVFSLSHTASPRYFITTAPANQGRSPFCHSV